MKKVLHSACLCVLLCTQSCSAHADSGRLRFSRSTGPFLVTLFTTPEPLTPGRADFSVMVQDAATGQILPDAEVTLSLHSTTGQPIQIQATRAAATNKLLQATEVGLPAAGTWYLHLKVTQASRSAALDDQVSVQPGSRKLLLIWIFALLPALSVGLFALHQRQKLSQARQS